MERQTANIIRIKDINNSSYVKVESSEFEPNYILVNSRKISRVNIMAAVVDKTDSLNYKSITLDDGTGSISVRVFGESDLFNNLNVGDAILTIAKPREFNSEKYLIPEVIKKIKNKGWIEVRKKELELIKEEVKEEVVSESEVVEEHKELLPAEKIVELIRKFDKGEGADFETVVQESKLGDAEKILNNLLTQGDVFEVKPGKLKVLD